MIAPPSNHVPRPHRRQYIVDILKELSDKKFGTQVNGDFTGPSDSSHAPLELQSGGSDQIVLGTEKDEGEGVRVGVVIYYTLKGGVINKH